MKELNDSEIAKSFQQHLKEAIRMHNEACSSLPSFINHDAHVVAVLGALLGQDEDLMSTCLLRIEDDGLDDALDKILNP